MVQHLAMLWMGRSILTLVHVCACACGGGYYRFWGMGELCCKVMAEAPNASHIYIICKQSVIASCYAVYGHMGPPLHCFTFVKVEVNSWKLGVWLSLSDVVR